MKMDRQDNFARPIEKTLRSTSFAAKAGGGRGAGFAVAKAEMGECP